MRRHRLLKNYALAVGLGLVVVGLVGVVPSPPSPLVPNYPENLLHIGTGLLFVAAGRLVADNLQQLRAFLFGMGILLVLAKVVITAARWPNLGLEITMVGGICLVAGVGSMLIAALGGRRHS